MAKKSKGVMGAVPAPMPATMPAFEMREGRPAYPAFPTCQDQGPSMKNLNFVQAYAKGESGKGFTAQTANGTAKDQGTGWNRDEPWSSDWTAPEGGPWKGGPSNRTGE